MRFFVFILTFYLMSIAQATENVWFTSNKAGFIKNALENKLPIDSYGIKVYKYYYQEVREKPLSLLKKEFEFLRRNNIKVAIEWPALTWQDHGPGYNVEGFAPKGFTEGMVNKVKDANGSIDYIDVDEIVYFGHFKSGEHAPHYSIDKIAQMSANNLKYLWDVFPEAKVGFIEPFSQMYDIDKLKSFEEFIPLFKKYSKHDVNHLHYDVLWSSDWLSVSKKVAHIAENNSARFGVIFNSKTGDEPSDIWMNEARNNIRDYLLSGAPDPHNIVFQSWNKSPDKILPIDNRHAHLSLIGFFENEKKVKREKNESKN